ncbi:MAG: methyltransferase domain-containing protein [Gammaproteobacteria bacterium]|nr:methyltransferase domain-containing protein [Gammaproteobacteria bacterium]
MKSVITLALIAMSVIACNRQAPPAVEGTTDDDAETPAIASPETSIYADAVANTSRLEGDYARDASRKPVEVLEFIGIAPGQTVLDLFSGGGYYSELLSRVVGSDGQVYAHSNEAYLSFAGDEFIDRHANGRLPNVKVLMAENNELELDEGSLDAIMMVLAYHDVYYAEPQNGWPKIDVDHLLAELYQGLKPDGIVGIVDHYAEAGAPRETGGTLHRIDRNIVIADFESAGFELAAKSDVLRNMNDDYSKNVFEPDLRGKTDRFVLKFRKPK